MKTETLVAAFCIAFFFGLGLAMIIANGGDGAWWTAGAWQGWLG